LINQTKNQNLDSFFFEADIRKQRIRALDIFGQRPSPYPTAGRHAARLRQHKDQRAIHVEYDVPIAGNGWTRQDAPGDLPVELGQAHVQITSTLQATFPSNSAKPTSKLPQPPRVTVSENSAKEGRSL